MEKEAIENKIRDFAESMTINAAIEHKLNNFEAEEICSWIRSKTQGSEEVLDRYREEIARAGQRVLAYSFRAVRAYLNYFDRGTPWEKEHAEKLIQIAEKWGIDYNSRYFTLTSRIGAKRDPERYDGGHIEDFYKEEGAAE